MEMDIHRIYHNYIIRMVIFTLYLHKGKVLNKMIYLSLVRGFLGKRLPWDLNMEIEHSISDVEKRDMIIGEILSDKKEDKLYTITVKFTTPLKRTTIVINLNNVEAYEHYLYS